MLVQGRVQGVGFRWFVRERAAALGLAGWVRNTPGGDVEIAARGAEGQIADLVSAAGQGPRGARVTQVVRLDPPAGAEYPVPFRITP